MIKEQFVAYLPGTDTRLGLLPQPTSYNVAYVHNIVGALQMQYSSLAAGGDLISQKLEDGLDIAVEWNVLGGPNDWFEPFNSRFLLIKRNCDLADPSKLASLTCPSYGWLLNKVRNLNEGAVEGSKSKHAGQRKFATADPGDMIKKLLDEHQARRGDGVPLLRDSWTATNDSDGHVWAKRKTWYIDLGDDVLTTLQGQVDSGHCDWRTQGRGLRIYNPNTHWADRSSVVQLRVGKEISSAPVEETLEDLVTHIFVKGEKKVKATVQNEDGPTPWGHWEGVITEGGLDTVSEAQDAANKQLEETSRVRGQYTYTLALADTSLQPMADYQPGDWVMATTPNGDEVVRVQQITMSRDSDGVLKADVILNDRFTDAALKLGAKVTALSNATSAGGSGSNTDVADPTDYRQPEAPTGFTVTPQLYLLSNKRWAVRLVFDWNDVTTATDGTDLEIGSYTVWGTSGLVAAQVAYTPAGTTTVSLDGLEPGSTWTFSVNAQGTTTTQPGAMATPVTVTLPTDEVAPVRPSAGALESAASVVTVTWDGLDYLGAAMAADTVGCRILADTANPPTTVVGTLYEGGSWSGYAEAGGTVYVRLVAFDSAGNESTPSTVSSIVVKSVLDDTDLAAVLASKNAIYQQNADPVTTSTVQDGDWWFKTSPTNPAQVIAIYVRDAGVWVQDSIHASQVLAAGSIVAGQLAADAVVADNIKAGEIYSRLTTTGELTADVLRSGLMQAQITLSGIIRTAETGKRVVIDSTGITLYDADDNPVTFINTNGESFFTGTVSATSLKVIGTMELTQAGNQMTPGSTLVLSAGIQAPSSGPTVSSYWSYNQLKDADGASISPLAVCRYKSNTNPTGSLTWAGATWISLCLDPASGSPRLVRVHDSAGAQMGQFLLPMSMSTAFTTMMTNSMVHVVGTYAGNNPLAPRFVLAFPSKYDDNGDSLGSNTLNLVCFLFDPVDTSYVITNNWSVALSGSYATSTKVSLAPYEDGTFALKGQVLVSYFSSSSSRQIHRWVQIGGALVATYTNPVAHAAEGGCIASWAGPIDGVQGFGYTTASSGVFNITKSDNTNLPNSEFSPANAAMVGAGYDTSNWWSADSAGRVYRYNGITWSDAGASKNHDFLYTYYNATPYESKPSPKTTQPLKKRAMVKINVGGWAPGSPAANVTQLRFYGGLTGGTLYAQGNNALGYLNTSLLATSGSTPPAATTFPASIPAKIANTDETMSLDALGQLVVPVMPKLGADKLVEHGSNSNGSWYRFADGTQICTIETSITPVANSNTGKTWTYPQPFLAGSQPIISVTGNTTAETLQFVGFTSAGVTSVSLRIVRSNTTSTQVHAVAIGVWK